MSYIDTQELGELLDVVVSLIDETGGPTTKRTVVLSGHYALYWLNNHFSDHLAFPPSPASHNDYFKFAHMTLHLGCKLVKRSMSDKLLFLVNDWQFFGSKTNENWRDWESLKAKVTNSYYTSTPELPPIYTQVLGSYGLKDSSIEKRSNSQWLFSESEFRSDFVKDLRHSFKEGTSINNVYYRDNGSTREYRSVDEKGIIAEFADTTDDITLIHGNSTNCSGEVIGLIREILSRGYERIILLHPSSCLEYVNVGTLLVSNIYRESGLEVINISIPLDCNPKRVRAHHHSI
ncbi:MAG: hypothetical protein AB2770_03900 [Candidatus Thiodiazotropha taylori]